MVVISDYTEQSVKDLFPKHENKLIKLYNGINIDSIRKKALKETAIKLKNPSIVFVGRLEDRKDPLRCINVLRLVHQYTGGGVSFVPSRRGGTSKCHYRKSRQI